MNSSRKRPDLSFFCSPSEEHFRRLRKNFCRHSDHKFKNKKTSGFAIYIFFDLLAWVMTFKIF